MTVFLKIIFITLGVYVWCTEISFCQLTAYIFDKRYKCCTIVHAVEIGQCFMHVSFQLVEVACVSISPPHPEQSQLAVYRTGSGVA